MCTYTYIFTHTHTNVRVHTHTHAIQVQSLINISGKIRLGILFLGARGVAGWTNLLVLFNLSLSVTITAQKIMEKSMILFIHRIFYKKNIKSFQYNKTEGDLDSNLDFIKKITFQKEM